MPFQSDTRCPFMRVQLNTSYIAELLEDLLEMDFVDDTGFDGYVELIEDEFSCFYCNNPTLNFNDWFLDNYNNYSIYDDMVEKCFVKRDGFGTEYHDGSGFADCDPTGSGNRLCVGLPKSEMCSECIYLKSIKKN